MGGSLPGATAPAGNCGSGAQEPKSSLTPGGLVSAALRAVSTQAPPLHFASATSLTAKRARIGPWLAPGSPIRSQPGGTAEGSTGCGLTPTRASSLTLRPKVTCGRASIGTTGALAGGGAVSGAAGGGAWRKPSPASALGSSSEARGSGQDAVDLKCSIAISFSGSGSGG